VILKFYKYEGFYGGIMRTSNVSHKLIGKHLAKDVFCNLGRLLLGKNVSLTASLIDKLIDNDIYFVYIDDEMSKGVEITGLIRDEQMLHCVKTVKNVLNNVMKKNESGVSLMIREQDIDAVSNVIKSLIEALEDSESTLYTFSINS
jgi:copper chaperone CopZ